MDYVKSAKVSLSFDQIQDYLNKKYFLQKIIEEQTKNCVIPIQRNHFIHYLDSFTLEYFEKYIEILKEKCMKFIHIIHQIQSNKLDSSEKQSDFYFQNMLSDYDFKINGNGDIYYPDLIRLLEPFIYNFFQLKEKVGEANQLDTYLLFSVSKKHLYRDSFIEEDLFPKRTLQIKSLNSIEKGYILLSENQKQQLLLQEHSRNIAWLTFMNQIPIESCQVKVFK